MNEKKKLQNGLFGNARGNAGPNIQGRGRKLVSHGADFSPFHPFPAPPFHSSFPFLLTKVIEADNLKLKYFRPISIL